MTPLEPPPSAGSRRGTGPRPGAFGVAGVVVAAAYAAWASETTPFTVPVDVAVSIPSALFVAALVLQARWPGGPPWRRMTRARPAGAGAGGAAPWLVVIAILVSVELASYFHAGPRAEYPTISFGLNALFRYRALRATGWFVWLTLGWFLVRR